ncbi:MAG TPA: hypothetical protein VJS92_05095 [Candidatus Polarisedimenticolaceae bacterium]|nr:hypothetical protein [Candidatus Polarisedimenticolaceae bacterium]
MVVPLPREFFREPRPAAGSERLGLVLGDLAIELDGLDRALAELLAQRFGPYAVRAAETPGALRVAVGLEPRDYFIDPPREVENVRVLVDCDGPLVRYLSYRVAGWLDPAEGRGQLLLARGAWEPPTRSFENFLRVAVAWRAVVRGGALVHAASAVHGGKGYLFYGESGAGKSTLSAANRRARVVSDDLSLVLPGAAGLELVGSPFRGTYEGGDPVLGRFPLAAGFRLIQAPVEAVRAVPRLRALAELVGNLPFVAEAFGVRPDLFATIERAFAPVPLAHLHFTRGGDGYWDAIAAAGY